MSVEKLCRIYVNFLHPMSNCDATSAHFKNIHAFQKSLFDILIVEIFGKEFRGEFWFYSQSVSLLIGDIWIDFGYWYILSQFFWQKAIEDLYLIIIFFIINNTIHF